jgi:6-phosphogluconolactonase
MRHITRFVCVLLLAMRAGAGAETTVYIGSMASGGEGGVFKGSLDLERGVLSGLERVNRAQGAGFIVLSADGKTIYCTGGGEQPEAGGRGAVCAFRVEGMKALGSQLAGGRDPCHLSLHPSGRFLFVANYTSGSCAALPIDGEGALRAATSVQQHAGRSVHVQRQQGPHAHSIYPDPSGRRVLVADLGTDKVMVYQFDEGTGVMTPNDPPYVSTEPGGGPRHLAFHPSGKMVYVNLELSSQVVVYDYDAETGVLIQKQMVSSLPEGFTDFSKSSEIRFSSDGRFLYVANRGHDSLAVFSVDPASGRLRLVECVPCGGRVPRHFNIDPSGHFLLVANKESDEVTVFRLDRETGLPEPTGSSVTVRSPSCVQFVVE